MAARSSLMDWARSAKTVAKAGPSDPFGDDAGGQGGPGGLDGRLLHGAVEAGLEHLAALSLQVGDEAAHHGRRVVGLVGHDGALRGQGDGSTWRRSPGTGSRPGSVRR